MRPDDAVALPSLTGPSALSSPPSLPSVPVPSRAPVADSLVLRGELKGHRNWVTSIATTDTDPNKIITGSRDKSVLVWNLQQDGDSLGKPVKALRGHSHFVSDVTLSSDGNFCLSASWDGTLRLWDLVSGETTRQFTGHKKDALSVAFSPDNRQIVSGSRDRSIKLWCVQVGRAE